MSTPTIASNAYQMAARLTQQANPAEDALGARNSADFGQMVQQAVETVVDQGRASDQKAVGLVEGKTDVVDVVTAIAETEVALETMVTVRDRVISAYEEIMRMPI
ncbi:flagellar hook-basal body complex protein FliE [Roseibium hamelinense]|uniref:Flagellar hook-basal body complex protein FliE n=1 Tax=Roseibium hamelinense TaxID=150831 RepID=A0A562TAX3_9HYPH|nr:flagellar hook-basal body complex protein FliE [Roseibium hamelinense]MTI45238.1 flagellar hook-basal body complex protein FliE [Roseibium hamelinense]TWI90398.1 flagellar hook-basal body complex protein FliE [Roseibium hamelinense]